MSYIEKFKKWETLKIYESFEKIFEQNLKVFPSWAKLTIDTAISGSLGSDYKLVLVKTKPTAKADTSFKQDGYDVVNVFFDGVTINKTGSNLVITSKGPMMFYAKSSEPWYLYQTKQYAQNELDPATRIYCKNGGPVSQAIKRVSKKGLTKPTGVPAEIEGNTLKWAQNNQQINNLVWTGDQMKSHLFTYMYQQGKIDELKTKLNDEISKQTGKYLVTVKNPGMNIKEAKPTIEKIEESLIASRINESKVQVLDAKDMPDEKETTMVPGVLYNQVGMFILKDGEDETTPRVKKWEEEQRKKGYKVTTKYRFTKDPRDMRILLSLVRVLDEVNVELDKQSGIKVWIKEFKIKSKALKNTILDLKDDKTWKSELEGARIDQDLLDTLRDIYGEKEQTGVKSDERVKKRLEMLERHEDFGQLWSEKQLKRLSNRFKEIYTPIYKGYSTLEDVFGTKEDRKNFKWASPSGRRALVDVRKAHKAGKISDGNLYTFTNALQAWDIEAMNKEIAEEKARIAKRKAEEKANRNFATKFIEDRLVPGAKMLANSASDAIETWYDDSVVKDAIDWSGEQVDKGIENVKGVLTDFGEDIGEFYNRNVITPLGMYLILNIKKASVSEIINPIQAGGQRGHILANAEIDLSYRLKAAGRPSMKSNVSKVKATLKMNYDLDLKTKEIKVLGLSIPKISSEWLIVKAPLVAPLKVRIRQEGGLVGNVAKKGGMARGGGKIYLDIKLGADPDKSEGDDWWEWYDKMKNKVKAYTYSVDITNPMRKSLAKLVKDTKPINLKELGLKNLPM